jgi:hypothetical protein
MKLYKFYSNWDYFEEAILKNILFFSDVSDFNDPYEEEAVFKIKGQNTLFSVFDRKYGKLKNASKICCFTKNPINYLMWSHYANRHKGYCVYYDFHNVNILSNRFCYTNIFNEHVVWGKIEYKNPVIEFDAIPRNGLHNDKYLSFFYNKYEYWRHEEEVRALIMSDQPKKLVIPKSYIKGVILGCKCPDLEKVKELVIKSGKRILINQTSLSFSDNSISVNTI